MHAYTKPVHPSIKKVREQCRHIGNQMILAKFAEKYLEQPFERFLITAWSLAEFSAQVSQIRTRMYHIMTACILPNLLYMREQNLSTEIYIIVLFLFYFSFCYYIN